MVDSKSPDGEGGRTDRWGRLLGEVGVDWWATALAGVITVLAVAGVLPKIPW